MVSFVSQEQSTSTETDVPAGQAPLLNIANALTVLRLVLVPVFVVIFLAGAVGDLTGTVGSSLTALAVFALAAATDKLDGSIARARGLVTDFGKLADPIADKALVISALVLLSWSTVLPWWVTVVIIVRELGITLLRFVMVRRAVMAASQGGKIKAVFQFAFIMVLLVPWGELVPGGVADVLHLAGWALALIAVGITVLTGLDYVVSAVRIARAPRQSAGAAPADSPSAAAADHPHAGHEPADVCSSLERGPEEELR